MRDDRERLFDILEATDRIGKYADRGRPHLTKTSLFKHGYYITCKSLAKRSGLCRIETTENSNDIEWSKIIGMRNILVHNYFSIDTDIVWAVIENDLHILKSKIREFLDRHLE